MKQLLVLGLLFCLSCSSAGNNERIKRYEKQAARVTIIRDTWGIPHVFGKSDADAVFGLMYAQCEENFERVERAYLQKMGRLAEVDGVAQLYDDLKMRLIYDTAAAKLDFQKSPSWLKKLLHAFADGINFYLYKHPEIKPAVLKYFEPWWPLLFTDGGYTATQTGGLEMNDMKSLYPFPQSPEAVSQHPAVLLKRELTGSNGFAIAPHKTVNKKALLYINPHVSFHFRTEMHMVSEEGLNAYGAVTWGNFFVYQGFNEHCGWMHTSSLADASDLYAEKIGQRGLDFFYQYDSAQKKVTQKQHFFRYRENGIVKTHRVTAYYTHHGPVVGGRKGTWLSLKEENHSLNGLMQSWQRMKANSFDEFKNTLQLQANVSSNTMYADAQGNIAYWHGNFIPIRNKLYDWTAPVDGTTRDTEWQGVHSIDEVVHVINPEKGWIQNCNSSPFSATGKNSNRERNYPSYIAPEGENFRSLFAIKELENEENFTIDKLIALGYNHYLAAFDSLLPPLFEAYGSLPALDPVRQSLRAPITLLRSWDKKSSIASVATTLAVLWAYTIIQDSYYYMSEEKASHQAELFSSFVKTTPPKKRLEILSTLMNHLQKAYGSWKVPWGGINRYQRLNGDYYQGFENSKPSQPAGMASSLFGCLPAYETTWYSTKGYGVAGNSFVAVVEFGHRVKAKSVVAGGQSFNPRSKHFADQAFLYLEGKLKDVFFYKEDVLKNAEHTYQPGKE